MPFLLFEFTFKNNFFGDEKKKFFQNNYFFLFFTLSQTNENTNETNFKGSTLRYKPLNIWYFLFLGNNRKLASQNFHIQRPKTTMNSQIYSILKVINKSLTILEPVKTNFRSIRSFTIFAFLQCNLR